MEKILRDSRRSTDIVEALEYLCVHKRAMNQGDTLPSIDVESYETKLAILANWRNQLPVSSSSIKVHSEDCTVS